MELKNEYVDERTEITYTLKGDYYFPNLSIPKDTNQENVTEELKANYQLEWVARMNNIKNRAEEIVYNEYVYN